MLQDGGQKYNKATPRGRIYKQFTKLNFIKMATINKTTNTGIARQVPTIWIENREQRHITPNQDPTSLSRRIRMNNPVDRFWHLRMNEVKENLENANNDITRVLKVLYSESTESLN